MQAAIAQTFYACVLTTTYRCWCIKIKFPSGSAVKILAGPGVFPSISVVNLIE